MFCLSLFLPIPAFEFEPLLLIVLSDQLAKSNIDEIPVRVQVVLDDCSAFGFNKSVVLSYLQEFEVRIALVPPIEPRISVH